MEENRVFATNLVIARPQARGIIQTAFPLLLPFQKLNRCWIAASLCASQ
jgi:hypothetical protein